MTLASPTVVLDQIGGPELFMHGLDHKVYRLSVRDGRWQPWAEIASPQLMRGSASASRSGDGSPQVLFEGPNGQIFRSVRGSGGLTSATQRGVRLERAAAGLNPAVCRNRSR
ncbi:hypothetical protein SAMN04488564_103651 [Lentzea waywayandensis]|uniref:Uncharacterized protein n=1 Tax=Lentzea waywayandensis TaxID=84724 RepID=A0A1I6E243_9PSEU|nr:hypothetical protein [Lentzea waywayandensis]SFR11765.1 hypothetical protein SAMN04488564_103651 [Lentzea waywayandensis]